MNKTGMKLACAMLSAVMLSAAAMPVHALEAADGNEIVPADAEITVTEAAGTDSNIITPGEEILHPAKTLTDNKDGTYTVKLEQYAEASTKLNNDPVDVVLILDISSSMTTHKMGNVLNYTAMKNSVFHFLDNMNEENSEKPEEKQSRAAVVTFSEGSNNTVLKAMTPINSDTLGAFKNKISSVTCKGYTYTEEGLRLGRGVLEADDSDRRKCVILFTDGRPCHGAGFSMEGAAASISESHSIKASGAEIFAVVIDPNCTSRMPGDLPEYEASEEEANGYIQYSCPYTFPPETGKQPAGTVLTTDENMTALTNRFMQLMTSNYPDALGIHEPGDAAKVSNTIGTYYVTADSSESLDREFQNIYYSVCAAADLPDENAQIRDFIADDFVLDDTTPVSAYTMEAVIAEDGSIGWGEKKSVENLNVTAEADCVKVSGFDYSENVVIKEGYPDDPDDHGRKLVVEFKIRLKNKTFGGNNIPSNKDSSGIYKNDTTDEVIDKYPVPHTDIPIEYEISCNDQEIFAPDSGKTSAIPDYADGYVPDGKNNAHVDISYVLTNDNGETVGTLNIPAGTGAVSAAWQMKENEEIGTCGQYKLTCTITPVSEGSQKSIERTKEAQAHVYYPEICLKDSVLIYGDEADIQEGDIKDPDKFASHISIKGWVCADGKTPESGKEPALGVTVKYPDGIAVENGKNIIRTVSDVQLEIDVKRLQDGDFEKAADVTANTVFTHACIDKDCPSVTGANDNICRIHVTKRVVNITSGSAEKTYNGKALTYKAASPWITSGTDETVDVYVNEALKDPSEISGSQPLVYVSDFSTITNPGSVKNDFTVKGIFIAVNNANGSRILKEVTEGYEINTQTGRLKVKAAAKPEDDNSGNGGNEHDNKEKVTSVAKVSPISAIKPVANAAVPEAVNASVNSAKNSPSTGDESRADIYLMLIFLSGIFLFVWVIAAKTRKLYEDNQ